VRLLRPIAVPRRLELRRSPSRDGLAAMGIYRPMRWRSRLAVPLWRFGRPESLEAVVRGEERAAILSAIPDDAAGLCLARSSTPDRWIIGVARNGRLDEVVKVGRATDHGLHNELAVYASHQIPIGGHMPTLLRTGSRAGYQWMGTKAVEGPPCLSTEVALRMAVTLARAEVTHGDFAPWNLLGPSPLLIDWEWSANRLRPMHDLAHFVVQSWALLGRPRGRSVLTELVGQGGIGVRYLSALGLAPGSARMLVLDYISRADESGRFLTTARARSSVRDALS
jgi:hypothetical protein